MSSKLNASKGKKSSDSKVKSSVMIPTEIMAELRKEAKITHRTISGMIAEIAMEYIKSGRGKAMGVGNLGARV